MRSMLTGRTCITTLAILLAVFAMSAEAQQLYRWVDKNGRVTYSQNPPPAGAATSVQQKSLGSSVVEGANLPYAAQVASKNFPVTLYTAPDCAAPCKDGRDYLAKRGIPYKEMLVGDEPSMASLKNLTGKTQVPVLQVGRDAMSGFNSTDWKTALDLAGYPASIPASIRPTATVQRNLPVVKLYVTPLCGPPCQNAHALLTARAISFQLVLVQDDAGLEDMKKATGSETVPVLMIGGSTIRGFAADLYQSSLDNAGFPRTASTATPAATGTAVR